MLSDKKIVCPNNLLTIAKKKGTIDAAIVNAGEIFPMESVLKAVENNLISVSIMSDNCMDADLGPNIYLQSL